MIRLLTLSVDLCCNYPAHISAHDHEIPSHDLHDCDHVLLSGDRAHGHGLNHLHDGNGRVRVRNCGHECVDDGVHGCVRGLHAYGNVRGHARVRGCVYADADAYPGSSGFSCDCIRRKYSFTADIHIHGSGKWQERAIVSFRSR